jgi:hypothetical protein
MPAGNTDTPWAKTRDAGEHRRCQHEFLVMGSSSHHRPYELRTADLTERVRLGSDLPYLVMDMGSKDQQLESLLRSARPTPDPRFRGDLRRKLEGDAPLVGLRPWWRPSRIRLVAAAFLAAGATIASLAGAGPLSSSNDRVQARDDCRYIAVSRIERVPRLVTKNGREQVVYDRKLVTRQVKRCR